MFEEVFYKNTSTSNISCEHFSRFLHQLYQIIYARHLSEINTSVHQRKPIKHEIRNRKICQNIFPSFTPRVNKVNITNTKAVLVFKIWDDQSGNFYANFGKKVKYEKQCGENLRWEEKFCIKALLPLLLQLFPQFLFRKRVFAISGLIVIKMELHVFPTAKLLLPNFFEITSLKYHCR